MLKSQGDYYFFNKNYEKALELYQQSFGGYNFNIVKQNKKDSGRDSDLMLNQWALEIKLGCWSDIFLKWSLYKILH